MKDFKTPYNRRDYYFDRTDPWKHIPWDDDIKPKDPETKWYFWATVIFAMTVIFSYVTGYIYAA